MTIIMPETTLELSDKTDRGNGWKHLLTSVTTYWKSPKGETPNEESYFTACFTDGTASIMGE